MIPTAENMYSALVNQINQTADEKDVLVHSKQIVDIIMKTLIQLKGRIKLEGFTDEQEEIRFYKYIKPKFHALYIYHATVFNVESDRPLGSKKATLRYFKDELRKIDNFFYHHLDLYKYYQSGNTYLDREYFTRGKEFNELTIDIATPIIDREYCTVHSIKISFLMAYQKLREYFQAAKIELSNPAIRTVSVPGVEPITWTDTKVGLVELAYALHAKGTFNHGKADLTQIIAWLEKDWNVELGNTSRRFQEVLSRQKGIVSFLEKLKKALTRRMIEGEE